MAIFTKTTVASITSSLNVMVTQLEAHAATQEAESQRLFEEGHVAAVEATSAQSIATKIKSLLS